MNITKEQATEIINKFPIAFLSKKMREVSGIDDRTADPEMNIPSFLFNTDLLSAHYLAATSKISGVYVLAFPVVVSWGENNTHFRWLVEVDPNGICDFEIQVIDTYAHSKTNNDISVGEPYTIYPTKHERGDITELIPSEVFPEIFHSFYKFLTVSLPCHNRDFSNRDHYFGVHPENCDLCHNTNRVVISEHVKKYVKDPCSWIGMFFHNFNYGKEEENN